MGRQRSEQVLGVAWVSRNDRRPLAYHCRMVVVRKEDQDEGWCLLKDCGCVLQGLKEDACMDDLV